MAGWNLPEHPIEQRIMLKSLLHQLITNMLQSMIDCTSTQAVMSAHNIYIDMSLYLDDISMFRVVLFAQLLTDEFS